MKIILWGGAQETAGEGGCVASEADDAVAGGVVVRGGAAFALWDVIGRKLTTEDTEITE